MTSSNVTSQQALLDRATVCLRLLRDNSSNPDNERTLECLRELTGARNLALAAG
jgi:hypothetical protein